MTATKPQPIGPGAGPQGFAQLRAQAAANLAEADQALQQYKDSIQAAFAVAAEDRDALAQAVLMYTYHVRILSNCIEGNTAAMRDAAVTEAANARQHQREFEQARAEERAPARQRKARDGNRHLGVVRSAGAGAAVLGTCIRAGRHSVPVKLTAGAAASVATIGLSAAGMHHLDDETPWMQQPNVAVMPSTAVPLSSSLPFMPAPTGRHSYPTERNRSLVLAAPSDVPSPQPVTYSYSSDYAGDGMSSSDSGTWQSDTSQNAGQQDSGMQVQGGDGSQQNAGWQGVSQQGPGQGGGQQGNWQRAGWQFQAPRGYQGYQGNQWNNRDGRGSGGQQGYQGGQGGYQGGQDGFQSHADGSWSFRDNSQQQGQQGGGWQQQGSGHDGGHGHGF